MRGHKWPIDEIVTMYNQGMPAAQIAEILGSEEWQSYWISQTGKTWKPHRQSVVVELRKAGCVMRHGREKMTRSKGLEKPWPHRWMVQWYNSGFGIEDIARFLSSRQWQAYWKLKTGLEYFPTAQVIYRIVKKCGAMMRGKGFQGDKNPKWKPSRLISNGYILVQSPCHPNRNKHGYVFEHRLMMEQKIGRYLLNTEVVHHIDGNRSNNSPDNLEVFGSNADHLRETTTGIKYSLKKRSRAIVIALRKHANLKAVRDRLIQKWYSNDLLTASQISGLLNHQTRTIVVHLKKLGINHARRRKGLMTTEILEECRRFLAILEALGVDVRE